MKKPCNAMDETYETYEITTIEELQDTLQWIVDQNIKDFVIFIGDYFDDYMENKDSFWSEDSLSVVPYDAEKHKFAHKRGENTPGEYTLVVTRLMCGHGFEFCYKNAFDESANELAREYFGEFSNDFPAYLKIKTQYPHNEQPVLHHVDRSHEHNLYDPPS